MYVCVCVCVKVHKTWPNLKVMRCNQKKSVCNVCVCVYVYICMGDHKLKFMRLDQWVVLLKNA